MGEVFDIFFKKDIQLWTLKSSFNEIGDWPIYEISLNPTQTKKQRIKTVLSIHTEEITFHENAISITIDSYSY